MKAHANDQVVAVIKFVLEEAEKGRIGHVSVTWGELPTRDDEPATFRGAIRGDCRLQDGAVVAMQQLTKQLESEVDNNTIHTESSLPKDHVCYDGATGPMCFDFCTWLVERTMEMYEAGLPGPLKVAFFFGKNGKAGLDAVVRRQFYENVYRPMIPMLGAVEHSSALLGHTCKFYLTRGIVAKYKAGIDLPKFKAPHAKKVECYRWLGSRKRPMVITLREADTWPHRNSNMESWVKFGLDLKAAGHEVIFVRDTAKAYWPCPPDIDDCPPAATDLQFRMALYESAQCCFFTSNGPHMLTVYSDVPYIVFIHLEEDGHPYEPDTPRFWKTKFGVTPGDQYPWARPDQHIAWGQDTYENITTAWRIYNDCVADYAREAAE